MTDLVASIFRERVQRVLRHNDEGMADPSERFWEDLLLFIEEGKVIPVIGPELVTVRDGEDLVPLCGWLARRLAIVIGLRSSICPRPSASTTW